MSEKAEISSLTGLRFLAALSVAIAHGAAITMNFGADRSFIVDWFGRGAAYGMSLFFVLSGFVIHYNYRTSVTTQGWSGVAAFIWARFSRLYPLFLLILFADMLLGKHLWSAPPEQLDSVLRALPYYFLSVQSWVYEPIRTHSLIYAIGTVVPVTWSISTEWFFYLAFPVIAPLVLFLRRSTSAVIATIVWCFVWGYFATTVYDHINSIESWAVVKYGPIASAQVEFQDSYHRWLLYFSPYLRIGEFILGCIVAQLYLLLEKKPVTHGEWQLGMILQTIAIVTTVAIVAIMYADSYAPTFLVKIRLNFGVAPSVALLIFCAARYPSWLSRFASSRPMIKLGDASYEIYLIHIAAFIVVAKLAQPFFGSSPDTIASMVRFSLGLGLTLLISLCLHTYFEVPVRRWLRGLWGPSSPRFFGVRRKQIAWSLLAAPAVIAAIIAAGVGLFLPVLAFDGGITVISATYGGNCGARYGNATAPLSKACGGQTNCDYKANTEQFEVPASNCSNDYNVEYLCASDPTVRSRSAPAEAGSRLSLQLRCPAPGTNLQISLPVAGGGIDIVSATYGANCGAPLGNVTQALAKSCAGRSSCGYRVDVSQLGDPVPRCGKDYRAEYRCGSDPRIIVKAIAGEAGFGSFVVLDCPGK